MKYIFSLVILLSSACTLADTLSSKEEIRELSDKVINQFIKKHFEEGLSLAKPYWPLSEVEIDGLANTINTQWPIVEQRFGKAIGSDFVRSEEAGDSLIRYYYLHKFNNHAIYWELTFYKPEDNWLVNSIRFRDDLNILFSVSQ